MEELVGLVETVVLAADAAGVQVLKTVAIVKLLQYPHY
jgi:hypothetical protein